MNTFMDPLLDLRPSQIVQMYFREVIDIEPDADLFDTIYLDLEDLCEPS